MCKTATLLSKICFGLMFIGLLFYMIGFWSPYWSTKDVFPPLGRLMVEVRGLWQMCQFTHLFNKCFPGADTPGSWFEAVQAFEVIGFIAAIVALILIILYIFVPATAGKKIVFILTLLATFAAAGCILLGIIIYGAKMDHLSWSFVLCTIAGIVFAISGILLLVDMCKR